VPTHRPARTEQQQQQQGREAGMERGGSGESGVVVG